MACVCVYIFSHLCVAVVIIKRPKESLSFPAIQGSSIYRGEAAATTEVWKCTNNLTPPLSYAMPTVCFSIPPGTVTFARCETSHLCTTSDFSDWPPFLFLQQSAYPQKTCKCIYTYLCCVLIFDFLKVALILHGAKVTISQKVMLFQFSTNPTMPGNDIKPVLWIWFIAHQPYLELQK